MRIVVSTLDELFLYDNTTAPYHVFQKIIILKKKRILVCHVLHEHGL
jgi:hypothetical protein